MSYLIIINPESLGGGNNFSRGLGGGGGLNAALQGVHLSCSNYMPWKTIRLWGWGVSIYTGGFKELKLVSRIPL